MNSTITPTAHLLPQDLIGFLENLQLSRYFELAPVTILYLDYFFTFSDEVEYIWNGEWSLVTFLYLFTKYFALLDTIVVLLLDFLPGLSPTRCRVLWHLTAWSYSVGMIIAEAIFTKRTVALWSNRPWIGRLCWGSLVVAFPVVGWLVEKVILSVEFAPVPDSLKEYYSGCFTVKGGNGLWISYLLLLVYETALFFLTIPKVWSQREDRKHLGGTSLSYVIYRDGSQFYAYILIVSIVNIVGLVTLQGGLAVSITRVHRVLHAILSGRLIINLRKVTNAPRVRGLNTTDIEREEGEKGDGMMGELGGLEFAGLDIQMPRLGFDSPGSGSERSDSTESTRVNGDLESSKREGSSMGTIESPTVTTVGNLV